MMTLPIRRLPLLFVPLVVVLVACGQTPSGEGAPSSPTGASGGGHRAKAPTGQPPVGSGDDAHGGAPPSMVQDSTFRLRAAANGSFRPAAPGQLEITLEPRGGYHVNLEFPIRVSLTLPQGVSAPKTTFVRSDAAEYTQQRARFDLPLTPHTPGEHRVTARVEFAVCSAENCIPDERTLSVVLPVHDQS